MQKVNHIHPIAKFNNHEFAWSGAKMFCHQQASGWNTPQSPTLTASLSFGAPGGGQVGGGKGGGGKGGSSFTAARGGGGGVGVLLFDTCAAQR